MFKFDRNNKEYVCKEAQINVNEVAFVCTPTKTSKKIESFENNFNLTSIKGFHTWYDAADPLGNGSAPGNGTTISSWVDKSPNKINMNATGNPQLVANSLNSLPGIQINAPGASFFSVGINAGTYNSGITSFAVYKNLGGVTYNTIVSRNRNGSNLPQPMDVYNDARLWANGGGYGGTGGGANLFQTNPSMFTYNLGANKLATYLNGKNDFNADGFNTTDIGDTLWIGTRGDKVTGFNGIVYEVIVFIGSLSENDRQLVEGYLASKWGINNQLPQNHPYFSQKISLESNLKATFYVDCNYQGQSSSLGVGRYDLPQMGIPNDSLSSIRIPNGLKVTIFEHGGFQGRSLELTSDEACLISRNKDGLNFNDVTSGIIVERTTEPYSYLPLAESEKDVGSNPQQSSLRGETRFGVVAGKKAALFNNKMETFIALANKTNNVFTVMFWIYKNDGGYYTAVSITDGNNPVLQFDVQSDRQIAYSALPNPWVHDNWSRASVAPGAWYHVAYIVNGPDASLYINGNKDNSFRGSGPMNSASRPLWFIGRSGDSGRAFNGAIRQFAVWNTVVDENTIKTFMKKTENDVDTTGIVKYVRVDGGGDYLQLSQVVVTDANGTNIAKGRKATSSGVGWDGPESAAVDGVEASRGHPGEYHSSGGSAWFQVELSSPAQVASVTIYNRADCCQGRLASGYRVRLLDSQGNVVFTSEPLNADAKQVIKITGPAGSKPVPPTFKKLDCSRGESQAGFTCYPQWLLNNDYAFTQGMDSGGNDIRRSGNADNIAELKKECDADPNCKGFNTNGFLKSVVKPVGEWYKWTDESNKGFYVKK